MTYRRKKYGRRRKRRTRRRKKARTYRINTLGGFPNQKTVRLRYVTEIGLNAGSGSIAVHQFRANSLYDPDKTGVGHQPSNFDPLMTMYDHYTVIGSKIKITPVTDNNVDRFPAYVGIYTADKSSLATMYATGGISNVFEQRRNNKFKHVTGEGGELSNPNNKSLTSYWSAKKFFGKPTKTMIGNDLYRGSASTSPTENALWEVYAASVIANDPGQTQLLVEIEYIAVLTEAKMATYS